MLSIHNEIFSCWETKEERIRKCDISTHNRWYFWLCLYKILIVILFKYNWCLLEHALLTHFSGSNTNNRTKIFILFLFKINTLGLVSNFIIIKISIINFKRCLIFKSLKFDNFSFKWWYLLSYSTIYGPMYTITVQKLYLIWYF
jgi:hypothetical protein